MSEGRDAARPVAGERARSSESDSDAEPRRAECAFSGLEDDLAEIDPGEVQTPHGESAFDVVFDPGVAQVCSFLNHGHLKDL